jgi:uracil-DNA glycosylase family 4
MNNTYVPGTGTFTTNLMIIGEAPSYKEVELGKPFVGPSGQELDRLLKDAGMRRSECWLTNVCKYYVPPAPKDAKIPFTTRAKNIGIDLEEQFRELQEEINQIKPNCILALGGTALWALTGKKSIRNYRGSIMTGMGYKTIPTYHPAHLLHTAGGEIKGYWNRQLMIFDFKRAHAQSEFPDINLPYRNLAVCRSSAQFQDFIDRHKEYDRLSVDIEARGHCIPVCVGLAFTPHEGLTIPLWEIIPDADMVQVWIMLAELLYDKGIVGQNFNYDRDKIRRLGFIIRNLVSDTMLKAFAINPELPKRLSFNTSIYTEEPFYKDEGMYEGSFDNLLLGCSRDACVTLEVDQKMDPDLDELGMRPFYENFLMKLPGLYGDIENVGFRQDIEVRDKLLEKYIKWDERLRYELFQMTGTNINVASPKQVSILLYENLKLPKPDKRMGSKTGTGEEVLTRLITSSKVKDDHKHLISVILEDRRVRKTIGTYLMALPDFDGRMRTSYFPCLETGRSSTSQQDPPIRPEIEVRDENNKKKKKSLGTAFQTMTKHGDIGNDVRSMYIADEGYVFLQADSSQAEARVVALLADDEDMLRLYDEHDIHALTASWFFGGTESDYSKKILGYEVPTRFVGKTLRHACHLGAKKRRAALTVNTDARKYKIDINITEDTAEKALEILHQKAPKIKGVFHNGIIECLERDKRRLVAPLPYGIDAPHGGVRTFFERWNDDLFRQAFAYIPQRAVTDNTKAAGLRIKDRIPGIKIVLESHDCLLFSVETGRVREYASIITEEMERGIDFSRCSLSRRVLSIPCDIEIGSNYMELKKLQLKAV